MNLLPSLLIATTIITGTQPIQIGGTTVDAGMLQQPSKNSCITGQVIIGNASDAESILDKLCINLGELLNNCLRPSLPDSGAPAPGPEVTPPSESLPDTNIPGDEIVTPSPEQPDGGETEKPEQNPDAGETIKPEQKPEEDGTVKPEETPDTDEDLSNKSYVEQVVALVNKERAKVNLPALTMSKDLNSAAQTRAVEIKQSFSHTRPNGSSFATVLSENNISYRGAGENIAWGQKTPEEVVNAWMNSSGHRANILNKNYTSIGVGYYLNGTTPYWAQLFTY